MNRGVVTLRVDDPAGLRELEPGPAGTPPANRGFRELQETILVGPAGLDCRLLIDDEEVEPVEGEIGAAADVGAVEADGHGPTWRWTPGFYAGRVRAELIEKQGSRSLGTWWLDVSPDPEKAGSEIFDAMVEALLDFDEALLVGEEPARRRLGALGDNDDPHILFERLRRREGDLDRAIARIQREPASVLRPRRRLVPFRAVRRTDLRTVRAALRDPEACAVLRPGHGVYSAFVRSVASEPRFDVPAVERRLDAPVNRCALYLLRELQRRCRHLDKALEASVSERTSETRTPLGRRLWHRRGILERIEQKMRFAERRSPFRDASRPELTSAGLTAVAAHPLYARLWRVGWEALRRGASRHDPRDLLALSPTWEVYERWCFVEMAGLLERWLPELEWSRCRRGVAWSWHGRDGGGLEIVLHYQETAKRTNGKDGAGLWSVSRECRPDLVLRWRRGGSRGFVALDAKWRTGREAILNGMAESAHLYRDALRWGAARPVASLLLVPRVRDELRWLAEETYLRRHGVGAVALCPDNAPPIWFRGLVLGEADGRR